MKSGELSKRGKRSKRKGRKWEQEIVKTLKAALPSCSVQRRCQAWGGKCEPDVRVGRDGRTLVHIEAKHSKRPNVRKAMYQAIKDADDGVTPIAVTKQDRQEPLATLRLSDFVQLLSKLLEEKCATQKQSS